MKTLSLFSGAMGLDLGLEKAGFEIVACIENDKYCVETIKLNRPDIKLYPDDINLIPPQKVLQDLKLEVGGIDLIVGGPPCQSFSTAGKRRGLNDFRGNVIISFLNYVKSIKPKYFILENVRGLLYAKLSVRPPEYQGKEGMEDEAGSVVYFLYKEFQKAGYQVSFSLFDSSLYGVPQKRERFVMFGTLSENHVPIPTPTTQNKPLTLRDAIGSLQDEGEYIELREVHKKFLKLLKGGQYWKDLPKSLQEEAMGKSFHLQGGKTGFYRRLSWDKPSPTLVTHPAMPATMLVHPDKLRPLTVKEYAAIQQFPKNWKFFGNKTQIYKQIGNAVPVGLGYMAGQAIMNHFKDSKKPDFAGSTSRYNGTYYKDFINLFESKIKTLEKQSPFEFGKYNLPPTS